MPPTIKEFDIQYNDEENHPKPNSNPIKNAFLELLLSKKAFIPNDKKNIVGKMLIGGSDRLLRTPQK